MKAATLKCQGTCYLAFTLECLVNELLYTPYSEWIKEKLNNETMECYISDKREVWHNVFFRKGTLKQQVELGVLGKLLESSSTITGFKKYLHHQKGMTNKKIYELIKFGDGLIKAAENRNKAAHGSDPIVAKEARRDKTLVYNQELSKEYYGLIIELLDILKK